MRLSRILLLAVLTLVPLVAKAQRERLPYADLQEVEKRWPDAKRSPTSLRTVVLKEGEGETVQDGDMVDVLYTGKLLNDTVFDEAHDPEHPFSFRVGRGQVIEGWDEGFKQLRKGEKVIFIIPYELGYGTRGQPPKIPRRATLVFEVELIGIHK